MQNAAAQYLAAIWSQGNVYDLIEVQCLYNSSRANRQTTFQKKENDRKRIHKQTCKDAGTSLFLNQGSGLAMARNLIIREMLTCNKKISETLQQNNEILKKLLGSP